MSTKSQNSTADYIDGPEEEYTDCVRVLSEIDAVWPGSTKIKNISVRLITVKIIYSYFIVYLDTG